MSAGLPSAVGTALDEAGVAVRLDHVAIAGARIRDLLPIYGDLLRDRFLGGGDNPRVGYRALQLGYDSGVVELMEPLVDSSFLDSFLVRGGGVHHVTFKVDDIRVAIAALEAAGVTPVGVHLDRPEWKECFVHPREAGGVLPQLADVAPGFPPDLGSMVLEDVLAGRGWTGTDAGSP